MHLVLIIVICISSDYGGMYTCPTMLICIQLRLWWYVYSSAGTAPCIYQWLLERRAPLDLTARGGTAGRFSSSCCGCFRSVSVSVFVCLCLCVLADSCACCRWRARELAR